MIRKSLAYASVAMCLALTSYGVAVALGVPQGGASRSNAGTEPKSPEQIRFDNAIDAIKLSAKQRDEYDALVQWMKSETKKMKEQGAGAMNYGQSLNTKWRAKLQALLTPAQWDKLLDLTGYNYLKDEVKVAGTSTQGGNPAAKFGSLEDQILATLNLTKKQREEIDALYAAIDVETKKLDEIWKGDDWRAVGRQGTKINNMQKDGMKRILTPEQLAKYLKAWKQDVKPQPDGKFYSPGKPMVGGGTPPPVANKL